MFLAGRVQDNILPEFLDLAGGRVVWMVQYVEEDLAFACFLLRQFQMALVILAASKISFPILNDFCELRSDVLGLVASVDKADVEALISPIMALSFELSWKICSMLPKMSPVWTPGA